MQQIADDDRLRLSRDILRSTACAATPAQKLAIYAPDVHRLDICGYHSYEGLKRWVALTLGARSLQDLGAIERQQETE